MSPLDHMIYGVLWFSFAVGHSVLAGTRCKQRLSAFVGAYYRLLYNALATAHIGLVWLLGRQFLSEGAAVFDPGSAMSFLSAGLWMSGLVLGIVALGSYDLGRFVGLTQVRHESSGIADATEEPLERGGIHRYVRHPLYAAAYLVLWGRVVDEFSLATALWGTFYLAIGTKLEERRLIRLYGESYLEYQTQVPALFPWRGRAV